MASPGWKTIGVSVPGFAHQAEGAPCEDFHAIASFANGRLVAVVSDGAGSAPRAVEGAKMICEGLVGHLAPHATKLGQGSDIQSEENSVRSWVAEGIESVRTKIAEISAGDPLSAFHATLVGAIAGPDGGFFFHLGDGAAFAACAEDFSQNILSHPENGEYANETYFFTQADWQEHLRLKRFDRQFDLLILMSDGVTPFALAPGAVAPHEPFFGPLSRYLASHTSEEGQRALAATLEQDAIRRITGDDKTLVWALRNRDG
jgi:hypothetical protein